MSRMKVTKRRKLRIRIPVAKPTRVQEPKTVYRRGREKAKLKKEMEGELEKGRLGA